MNNIETPVVLALVYDKDGKTLIARRNQPDAPEIHNKWELVGGKVEFDETPEEATVREVKEETGLDIELVGMVPKIYTHIWKNVDQPSYKVFLFVYKCAIIGGELSHGADPDGEIAELKFISAKEILEYDCLPLVKEIVMTAEDLQI